MEDYRAIPAANSHALMPMLRSPAHYLERRNAPEEPATPAKQFGTILHSALLEPGLFRERVRLAPDVNKRTKAGKEEWENFLFCVGPQDFILKPDQAEAVERMLVKVAGHPVANLLRDGASEVTALWVDKETGLDCKARFDYLQAGFVIDVKTTRDASRDAFARDAYRFMYDIQAAHYLEAALANGIQSPVFTFIAVESDPPHELRPYFVDGPFLEKGAARRAKAMKRLARCIEEQRFPGYPSHAEAIGLPNYAFYDDEEEETAE